eukprot:6236849-Amphidinium_carterae.1
MLAAIVERELCSPDRGFLSRREECVRHELCMFMGQLGQPCAEECHEVAALGGGGGLPFPAQSCETPEPPEPQNNSNRSKIGPNKIPKIAQK